MDTIVWLASYPRSGSTRTHNVFHNLNNLIQGKDMDTHDINAMGHLTTWEIYAYWHNPMPGKPPKERKPVEISMARRGVARTQERRIV